MLGPDSLLWRYAADARSLVPGTAAGLMQLMYPGLGAGVEQHSDFFAAPFQRIHRSVPQIWATIFEQDGAQRGRRIRDLHRGIGGMDHCGRQYHALAPETFWWAHATFTWEIFRSVQFFHSENLTSAQCEQLYAETVEWYERYGVTMRPVPADYTEFQAAFRRVCTDVLELTPSAARALEIARTGAGAVSAVPLVPEPIGRVATVVMAPPLRLLMFGCLPEVVRERFGVPWSTLDAARFAAAATAIAQGARLVPARLNRWYLRNSLRVVGAHTRDQRYSPQSGAAA
jgi:uncharacterized protein (DUF2236 family)